ncbi:hypothetical protein OOT46_12225 [Aquabacterium sp. A7-Y]|uniref:hypothetical protein n=1 Tax=Aquabacterium sp. A7-Y TaxID=1349605 RepID=UPI00223D27EC|nr:hypothetical protein [Aquabacterium sp. A7-Y]MCW7538609.1 hypothetical protein [Aquabacterium sp. A7-Y]
MNRPEGLEVSAAAGGQGISALCPEASLLFLSFSDVPDAVCTGSFDEITLKEAFGHFDLLSSCNYKHFARSAAFLAHRPERQVRSRPLRSVLRALRAWSSFDYDLATDMFLAHMEEYPSDVLAFYMLHMLDFSTGRTTRMMETLHRVEPHVVGLDHPLESFYMAIKAFVLCEVGQHEASYLAARRACELNPENIYAIHAAVHVLHERRQWDELIDFLITQETLWMPNAGMKMHVCWHLAVAYLMKGDVAESKAKFFQLRTMKSSRLAKEDLDAVAYLWRYRLRYPRDSEFDATWRLLSRLWTSCIGSSTSYFHSLHAALSFAAVGEPLLIEKLVAEHDDAGGNEAVHRAGRKVLSAIHRYAIGDVRACADLLHESSGHWRQMGGSNAQRELLELTLQDALARCSH